jgi:hypothetical protein
MWQSIICYLSGQHEFAIVCEPDAIFLQCRSCGRRSSGWELRGEAPAAQHAHATPHRVPELMHAGALVRRQPYSA